MKCKVCDKKCIKNGFQANGVQRYFCRLCKKSTQKRYTYKSYQKHTNKLIYRLIVNSCGINDISRVLRISRHTVKKRLLYLSKQTKRPALFEHQQSYEIDEMYARIKNKKHRYWITYAINRKTKTIVALYIGKRKAKHIANVVNRILLLNPKRIYSDHFSSYKKLIPKNIHRAGKSLTNHIERLHLNLRTHLKCLSRKTICFTKSLKTLEAIVRLYFWGNTINFKYV
ncbi:IS1 family transposase [Flavivirga amylovorans]|uniref:IS1 family transposase n=1 Tax=Flavivirga amylovorans TaxID=870486 RepID=A0ABT8WX79_9FLAO|nr:IS1 family transposase [Flavivirga amylovorans]MDO5986294.1 IS1 family transposase [Flavivirga amylovorans]